MNQQYIKPNPWSFVALSWLDHLLSKGYKTPLTMEDLPRLSNEHSTDALVQRYTLKKTNSFELIQSWVYFLKVPLLGGLLASTLSIALALFNPYLIGLLVEHAKGKLFTGNVYGLAVAIFSVQVLGYIANTIAEVLNYRVSQYLGSIITDSVYRKSIVLSVTQRKTFTSAKILNIVNQDAQMIVAGFLQFNNIVLLPFQLVAIMTLLWLMIGPSLLGGALIAICISLLNFYSGKHVGKYVGQWRKSGTKRISILRQVIQQIKAVKFMGIEDYLFTLVQQARLIQVNASKLVLTVLGTLQGITKTTPVLMALVTFAVYGIQAKSMDPSIIFPALIYLNLLRIPLNSITNIVSALSQAKKATSDLADFLNAPENELHSQSGQGISVDGVWKYDAEEEFSLEACFQVPRGSLVGILGQGVGAGKSTLLKGLLNDIPLVSGSVQLGGRVSYCSQEPWIIKGTIQSNILFGQELDMALLNQVVEMTGLTTDVSQWDNGLQTNVAENGSNLSGGQKARIGLARAIYSGADVLLLDDPLAACDSIVKQGIFDSLCVLRDQGKTVLLVTNDLYFVSRMSHVMILEKAKLVEFGTVEELMIPGTRVFDLVGFSKAPELELKSPIDPPETKPESKPEPKAAGGEKKEEKQQGSVRWPLYKKTLVAAGFVKTICFIITFLVVMGCNIATPLWLSLWTKAEGQSKQLYLGVYVGLGLATFVGYLLLYTVVTFVGVGISSYFHDIAVIGLFNTHLSFFEGNPVGRILNRLTGDVMSLDLRVASVIVSTSFATMGILSNVVLISQASAYLLILFLGIFVISYFIFKYYQTSNLELKRLTSISKSPYDTHFNESLNGVLTIRAYGNMDMFVKQQRDLNDDQQFTQFIHSCLTSWFALRLGVISSVVTLTIGLLAASSNNFSKDVATSVGLALTFSSDLAESIKAFLYVLGLSENEMNAIERLDHYGTGLEQEPPRYTPNDDPNWLTKGEIEYKDASVTLNENEILKDLTFKISQGQYVGICGRTGSGKSTLVSTLFRIMNLSKGTILVDGIDISRMGLHTCRKAFQIVPQETMVIEGTIRENLLFGESFTDEQIWDVLKVTGLYEFVSGCQEKLDFEITESGSNLSASEKQLLGVSRALLRNPKVLVLDEATSTLTIDMEARLIEKIRNLNATVISIAHHIVSLKDCDSILALDQGKLVEVGSPKELVRQQGVFYQLALNSGHWDEFTRLK